MRVFGSMARGDARPDSDVDLLVQMERGRSLFDLVELCDALEETLGRAVDVLTDEGISPYLRDVITAEARPL